MACEEWRYELMFASDVFEKLNNLNMTLQGKGLFAHEMLMHLRSFQAKVGLFAGKLVRASFVTFPFWESRKFRKIFL